LAQDPETGIITYGDTNVRHQNESDTVLEFLDFYRENQVQSPNYLVFDSRFTTYENLSRLDGNDVKFITIRRRGKKIVDEINEKPVSAWKKVRVMNANGKGRTLSVIDETIDSLKGYQKPIRQITITGHGKIKPALIITNDFSISVENVIRKYSKRWIVEKEISEQIEFFHLNRVSSSIVIKVDFDFTMTILAHNLYRLFARIIPDYSHCTDQTIFEKFLANSGDVVITNEDIIQINLKKKRTLPILLSAMKPLQTTNIPWLSNKKLEFSGLSTT
jgi:hypothetical protein